MPSFPQKLAQINADIVLLSKPSYNESMPTGGDPLEMNVNAQYVGFEYNCQYHFSLATDPRLSCFGMF